MGKRRERNFVVHPIGVAIGKFFLTAKILFEKFYIYIKILTLFFPKFAPNKKTVQRFREKIYKVFFKSIFHRIFRQFIFRNNGNT